MEFTTCSRVEYISALLNENLTQIVTNILTAQNKIEELEKVKIKMQANGQSQKFLNSIKSKKINNLLSCIELGTHMLIYKANELSTLSSLDQSHLNLVGDTSMSKNSSKMEVVNFSYSTNMIRSMQEQQKKIFQNEAMKIFAQKTKQIEAEEDLLRNQKTTSNKSNNLVIDKPPLSTNESKIKEQEKPINKKNAFSFEDKSQVNKIDIKPSLSPSISNKNDQMINIEKETENFLQAMLDHGQEKVAEEFLKQYIKQLNNPNGIKFKNWLMNNFSLCDDESERVAMYIQTWYLNCKLEQFILND
jgi:hypothetical protein